jgi:flagellar biosynthesis/type III secretory pathway protein FliH
MNGSDAYERGYKRARQEQQDMQSIKEEMLDYIAETNKRVEKLDMKINLYMLAIILINVAISPSSASLITHLISVLVRI